MIKRVIEISEGPTFLNVENDQLLLTREGVRIGSIPCEDIGVLLIDHHSTTITQAALTRLMGRGAAVVFCGTQHLPVGILLPMENNDLHTARLRAQVGAGLPLRKQLWRQIVIHKIRGQAENLKRIGNEGMAGKLGAIADEVKSGDSGNCEGVAARHYWQALMGEEFRRDPEGAWPNALLNYGYMVFRAAVGRAIVAAGLHPAIGLYHRNRNNAFVLADDLVEVFRPTVDWAVVEFLKKEREGPFDSPRSLRAGGVGIDKEAKKAILGLLAESITVGGQSGPLLVGLHRVMASLVRCFEGTQKSIELPE